MSMINIAYSGIQAAQVGMSVTSMNIANILTPGYSRQGIIQSAIGPMGSVGHSAGNGVQVDSIRRISSQYLINQVWQTNNKANYYNVGQEYLSALEQVIGTDSTSLGNGLDEFFGALSALTTQPESSALRQQLLTQAGALATRFNSMNQYVNTQKESAMTQRNAAVASINSLSQGVADYNKKIIELEAGGGNSNVLRDQRDELVKQMSSLVDVHVSEDASGSYTVVLKSGLPLVNGNTAGELIAGTDSEGNSTLELTFSTSVFNLDLSAGGQLGALYDYETGTLKDMQAAIQGMASSVADLFNKQLADGFDLNGQPGNPLFIFDLTNSAGMLQVTDLKPDGLALSSNADKQGNGENLQKLIDLKNSSVNIGGLGKMSLNEGAAAIISRIGIASRQNKTERDAAIAVAEQVQIQRDNMSAVNQDEEAINLQAYMQYYQSNLKVIATGDRIFSDLLNLF